MTETDARLLKLLARRAAATDAEDIAEIEASIADRRAALGLPMQSIDRSQVGVVIGGANSGSIDVIFQLPGVDFAADEQEALHSYRERLVTRCNRLRATGAVAREKGSTQRVEVTLSDVYITLATTAWETIDRADDAAVFADALTAGDADTQLPQHVRRLAPHGELGGGPGRAMDALLGDAEEPARVAQVELQRPLLLTRALGQRRRLVLLGAPGGGKSSFLAHLAIALARGDADAVPGWDAGALLPVLVSLGAYAGHTQQTQTTISSDTLYAFVAAQVQRQGNDALLRPFTKAFRTGRVALLCDGLDEVADPQLRIAVARAVAGIETTGYVAVTCRVRSFVGAVADALDAWGAPVEVAPLTGGQIRHFVRAWYNRAVAQGRTSAADADVAADDLLARVQQNATLRDLATTPLLLTIITLLYYYEGKLPDGRAELYEDMVRLLLSNWTERRRMVEGEHTPSLIQQLQAGGQLARLNETHIRNLVERLAYQAHQASGGGRTADGRGLLTRSAIENALRELFASFDLDGDRARTKVDFTLAYLEEESGLLLHEGGDMYALPHLTYEEYLCACHLAKQDFRQSPYDHWSADAPRWFEVILLALGRMVRHDGIDKAADWLDYLLKPVKSRRATAQQRTAVLAAECLREIGGRSALLGTSTQVPEELEQRTVALLAQAVAGTDLGSAERVRAGVLLGELGDPRTGVCTLPPSMIWFRAPQPFQIGSTAEEVDAAGIAWEKYYLEKNNTSLATTYRTYAQNEINDAWLTLRPFALARYPVTNAQYQLFIDDDGYNAEQLWWSDAARAWFARDDAQTEGLQKWQIRTGKDRPEFWRNTRLGASRPNHPVVGVNWYEAMAFCAWLTLRHPDHGTYCLPSEAEWEYAARGITRRPYPWGSLEPDETRANFANLFAGTTAVGAFAAGATEEGIDDMAGQVWEWHRSSYVRRYPYNPDDGREEASGDIAKKYFTLRGGGWNNLSLNLRAADRDYGAPDSHLDNLGFRLALHPRSVKD